MRVDTEALQVFAAGVLRAVGARAEHADVVASSLVAADRRGVASHGIVRLESYVDDVRAGRVDVGAEPELVIDAGATAVVDGHAGFGAVTGTFAIAEAIGRAERHGVGIVTARGGNHFGAASFYALRAVERGLVGMVATSTPAVMAPTGGSEARIGNNPIALAAPRAAGKPSLCIDFAQSAVSRGRIKLAELAGESIPLGWAIDAQGTPTTDATAALAGALLPFGAHKGYGLALAVEMLAGVLAGGDLGPELRNVSLTGSAASSAATRIGTTGSFYLALDPSRMLPGGDFAERVERVCALMRPDGEDGVLVPGELEARAEADARVHGIPLANLTAAALRALATRTDVLFPEGVSDA